MRKDLIMILGIGVPVGIFMILIGGGGILKKKLEKGERMIFNMDCKLIDIQMKLGESYKKIHQMKTNHLNNWLKEHGKNIQYLHLLDKVTISEKSFDKIQKIIKDNMPKNGVWTF